MPDEVTLDVTTIEENVTVETTAGDVVEIQVVAPTGPNSVTSATTSDGTANLSLSNVSTTTATVSGLLTAGHIHGNLAGTLYTHVRTGEAMDKGDPFYISGFHVGSSQPIVMRADASDASKMPAVGVMDADYANNTSGANGIISGTLSSINTHGYAVNSPIYVKDGGGYSNVAGTIRQQVGITERANTNTGAFIVTNSKVISFADISDAQTGTANLSLADLEVVGGEIYTDGDYSSIYTQGATAHIFTLGSGAEIYTEGELAQIYTTGASAQIYTAGAGATIGTQGANATIYTQGTNATISTAGSAAHIQTSHASAAVKSTNFAAVESGGASLVDGSMQPCLTWSAGGRNLTIPSGTATTFNTTSYTYGTGAAAAHRTALGLTTLATTTPGTNVANFLEFPTSANLASALTDENGTGGGFVRAEGATLTSPALVGPVNLTSQDASTADRVMTRDLSDTRYGQKIYSTISTTSSTVLASYDTLFTKVLPVGYYRFEYRVWLKNNEASASISPRINLTASSGTISVDGIRENRYNQGSFLSSCFRNASSANHDGGNLTVGSPNFTEGSMAFFGFINVTAQATMLFRFSHNTSAPTNPTTVEGHLVLEYLTAS